MTNEESKRSLVVLLNNAAEKEMDNALNWARIYEKKSMASCNSITAYVIASLVYLYETANGHSNNIGKALCENIDSYDEDEALKVLFHFRFPVIYMYNVVKEWEKTNDIPHLFSVQLVTKEYEIIHAAAARHDSDTINWLLNCNIDVDIKDSSGKTALHVACACGKMQIIRCLLSAGASIFSLDNLHQTPIEVALKYNNFEIAEFLRPNIFCNLRMDDGNTLLMKLIRDGHTPQVQYMLRYANYQVLNYSYQNLLHICAEAGHENIMEPLLEEDNFSEMLDAVDAFNETPLSVAIRNNFYNIAAQLLAVGAIITPAIRRMSTSEEIRELLQRYDSH